MDETKFHQNQKFLIVKPTGQDKFDLMCLGRVSLVGLDGGT